MGFDEFGDPSTTPLCIQPWGASLTKLARPTVIKTGVTPYRPCVHRYMLIAVSHVWQL